MSKAAGTVKKDVEKYFPHDINTRQSREIMKLLLDLSWEGYGIWWAIVEYMHQNQFAVDDESLLAYELRCDVEIIHKIMNNYGLFHVEEGCYISDRILRNLNYREEKSEERVLAAQIKWLLADFRKYYEEEFGTKPVLTKEEVESLKNFYSLIPDLRDKLRDIFYTLHNLKFDTDVNFKPCANWLLSKNNLARLVNGEFGKLKHKKTAKELKEEEKQSKQEQAEIDANNAELQTKMNSIYNKSDAIDFVVVHTLFGAKTIINPIVKPLCQKFDITVKELEDRHACS